MEGLKGRILVVDDQEDYQELIYTVLTGYEVRAVGTYEGAIEAIEAFHFDVAILDIRLQDENIWNVDGIDLLSRIRRKKPHSRVVILSGHRESVAGLDLDGYKPFEFFAKETLDNEVFRETVQKLVQQAKFR